MNLIERCQNSGGELTIDSSTVSVGLCKMLLVDMLPSYRFLTEINLLHGGFGIVLLSSKKNSQKHRIAKDRAMSIHVMVLAKKVYMRKGQTVRIVLF